MKKALVLSLVFALGLGFAVSAQTLSGSWDTTVTIGPVAPTTPTFAIDTTFAAEYSIGAWVFGVELDFEVDGEGDDGLKTFEIAADGVLGAFSIGSLLEFDAVAVAFDQWQTTIDVSIAGVTFGAEFTLATGTGLELTGSGVAGDVTIDITLTLGDYEGTDCDFDFSAINIEVGFPFYCADVVAAIDFSCVGFDGLCFSTTGIVVPSFPWLTLDAEVCFQTNSKTLTISPVVDFGVGVCIDVYMALDQEPEEGAAWEYTDAFSLGGIYIYGLGLEAEFGGVLFSALTIWDADFGGTLYPWGWVPLIDYDAWEVYTISTTDDGCCGPFDFDVSFFFVDSGELFGLSYIEANMEIQIASQFTFSTGMVMDLDNDEFEEWTLGFEVVW